MCSSGLAVVLWEERGWGVRTSAFLSGYLCVCNVGWQRAPVRGDMVVSRTLLCLVALSWLTVDTGGAVQQEPGQRRALQLTPGEWSCTSPTPETSGTYYCTSDCTMTSPGVSVRGDRGDYLTGDINRNVANLHITGTSSITTITANPSVEYRRHFYVTGSKTLTLKWIRLAGGITARRLGRR